MSSAKLAEQRVMSAVSLAISEASLMAMETSAVARAGASLMPSPIMTTFFPEALSSSMTRCFSSGRT